MLKSFLLFSFFVSAQTDVKDVKSLSNDYVSIISSYTQKVAVLYFESTDGVPRDGIIITEKLIEEIVKGGKIKVIDPMIIAAKLHKFGMKNIAELDYDTTTKLSKELGTSILLIGSVSRVEGMLEIRARLLKIPDFEILSFLTHRIIPDWYGDNKKIYPIKKVSSSDISDIKPTKSCSYPQLVKIAYEKDESKYNFSCIEFSCKIIDCSKYPTVKDKIFKIYFQDPLKTVIVTDDSFNILQEYRTNEAVSS